MNIYVDSIAEQAFALCDKFGITQPSHRESSLGKPQIDSPIKKWLNTAHPLRKVDCKIDFVAGAEYGYKEAIIHIKGILNKFRDVAEIKFDTCRECQKAFYQGQIIGFNQVIADFEQISEELYDTA